MKLFATFFAIAAASTSKLTFQTADPSQNCHLENTGAGKLTSDCDLSVAGVSFADVVEKLKRLPCDIGEEKKHGGMNDACVECKEHSYKSVIGYEKCQDHMVCVAGQEPGAAPRTNSTPGDCKNCDEDYYSEDIGYEVCKKQPDCKPGQYLHGGSLNLKGTCKPCPAELKLTDANGAEHCNWHGKCPAGQENEHAGSKTAKFVGCSNCKPGYYKKGLNSELCKLQTQCPASQSLIGESTTEPGTCHDKCHDVMTSASAHGGDKWSNWHWKHVTDEGGDVIYMDRHDVKCEANQVVGALGLTKFQLHRHGSAQIKYGYRCCDIDEDSEAGDNYVSRSTSCSGTNLENAWYLDRHSLDCSSYGVIKQFRLANCNYDGWGDRMKYNYQCQRRQNGACTTKYTACNTMPWNNDNVVYLDRHNVQCNEPSKPFMKSMVFERCSSSGARYRYTCCA